MNWPLLFKKHTVSCIDFLSVACQCSLQDIHQRLNHFQSVQSTNSQPFLLTLSCRNKIQNECSITVT